MDIETKRNTSDSLGKNLKIFNSDPPKSAFEIGIKSAGDILHKEANQYKPAAFLQHRLMMQRNNSSAASQYYAMNH
jgi:hypothetical protein